MKLKLKLDGDQEDKIVALSIKEAFHRLKTSYDPLEWVEDKKALIKAFKTVYHFYTGKILK
jgi:hypothetical protein